MRSALSPDAKFYYDNAMQHGHSFVIANGQSSIVMKRGEEYIDRFSDTKLMRATENVIETYPPRGGQYGYKIEKMDSPDSIAHFNVQCFGAVHTEEYANIVAYYIHTGTPIPDELIDAEAK